MWYLRLVTLALCFGSVLEGTSSDAWLVQNSGDELTVDLGQHEFSKRSQNGEDGVIQGIFRHLGETEMYFVEIGVEGDWQRNTSLLKDEYGWVGLSLDAGSNNAEGNLNKGYVTVENVNDLLDKYGVPYDFDLLSIDIDYNDFYLWKALSSRYSPKVVVIEYNGSHLPEEDKVVPYHPNGKWDGSNYYGASISALAELGKAKGYTLVYAENRGVNLFFVRNDLLEQIPHRFKDAGNVRKLYKKPSYGSGPNGGHGQDSNQRPYVSSVDVIQ